MGEAFGEFQVKKDGDNFEEKKKAKTSWKGLILFVIWRKFGPEFWRFWDVGTSGP